MPLIWAGLSHQNAPVEVREQLAFTAPGALSAALAYLRDALRPASGECVLLSTCNRTELYVWTPDELPAGNCAALLLQARQGGMDTSQTFAPYLSEGRGHRVIEHLFRVASGLESMVLGESDIVRQVKEAYGQAAQEKTSGPKLNALFHEALRVAKRARTETGLNIGAFGVGHAAAQMAQNIFGSLAGRTVLLLGAGKMSERTARHLASNGATSVLVANRTYDKAVRLAEALNGRAIRYDEFAAHLVRTDIVIASTASPVPVVHRDMVESVLKARRHRPLFLIDIAVPRDIEATVGDLPDVFLYNIDDLQAVVDEDEAERRQKAVRASVLIAEEAAGFAARLRSTQQAAPLVVTLREQQRAIVTNELARLRQKLPHLSDSEWQAVEAAFRAVENKTLHAPTVKIKEYAAAPEGDQSALVKMETARELFGLAPAVAVTEEETAP